MISQLPVHPRIQRIVANLLRHIPDPPAPIARPTGSFAGLRPGQHVRYNGVDWAVTATDSLGATVKTSGEALAHRITDRAWKDAGWSRIRAPRRVPPA